MAKIKKIEPAVATLERRKRVAAYARVSKDTERLLHSVSAQVSYYNKLIQGNPEWEFAGVYADTGLSGTGTQWRDEFQRLLADCEAGKIDIVLTKSISRFARNTLDLLETVRHLKELGVEVRFEKERINSFSGDGELMLSILASFAQEESRSISENVKWGVRKRFQSGEIGAANKHILGYRYDDDLEQYVIIPEEAEIVRLMFQRYLEGVPLQGICDELNDKGYRTINGKLFQEASLNNLIHNEIYAGDLVRQKCYMIDPIKKTKVRNNGELPQYRMTDCHEAILDRETYAKVQQEFERRTAMLNPTYCFTKKIRCAVCGQPFTRKKGKQRGKVYVHWICRSKKEPGQSCCSRNFSDSELKRICAEVLGTDTFDENIFELQVKEMLVQENGSIEFHLVGGETRVWQDLKINQTYHEFTVTDCFQGKVFCGKCGHPYHRVISANKWTYWYCIGKKYGYKGVECDAQNYADFQLRRISAFILGQTEFDEAAFEQQIEKITVLEDGSLEYKFYEGRTEIWQRRM